MNDQRHEEIKGLLPAYALGAVTQEELRAIRDHIVGCEECMAEADAYGAATEGLALSVEPVAIPSGFADAVLAKVGRPETTSRPLPSWNRWLAALGAASLLIIGLLTAALIDARSDSDRQREVLAQILYEDRGMSLTGETGAVARMIPTSGGGLFAAAGLEEPPEGRTYQLWVIRDGAPEDAGTFDVSDGSVVLEVEKSLEGAEAVAVTIEREGGSPQPTTDPVISS